MRTLMSLLTVICCIPLSAADKIPQKSIAKKGELLFEDNFEGKSPDKRWHKVVPTFSVEEGKLKGVQTREKDETVNGKVRKAHAAVHGLELPSKDTVVEVKILFEGATMIDVEFDDRKFKGCHYGHICRAQVRYNPKDKSAYVLIIDEKEGSMRNDIREMRKDPSKKAEVAKLLKGKSARFPVKIQEGKWYTLTVETVGDEMRVELDGKPAGYLKSPGIAHATKSKLEFGVAGKLGYFDDLKIWNAESVK